MGIINGRSCWAIIFLLVFICIDAECNELKMVHVIFRHGDKTPAESVLSGKYPEDTYANKTFFPYGRGGLTNDGKLTMYTLGTFLRRRYNDFLGDTYYPEVTRIRSTDMDRTKMSAQLVNAGLWPPTEALRWKNDLLWLPIPYEYVRNDMDDLMWSYKCPTYVAEYERVLQTDEVQKLIEPHREFFAYLSKHAGVNIARPIQVFFIYEALEAEVKYNLTIPSWTKGYFPVGEIYDIVQLHYNIASWGDLLKKINGGPLLREILNDYKDLIEDTSSKKLRPKITLFSGHESNIVSVLKTLGLWTPHIPDFSSAIMFELYLNNSTNVFGIQILYYLGKSGEMITLTLPGCTQICPVDEFTKLLSHLIPDDIDKSCGMNIKSVENRGSSASLLTIFYMTFQIWILLKMT